MIQAVLEFAVMEERKAGKYAILSSWMVALGCSFAAFYFFGGGVLWKLLVFGFLLACIPPWVLLGVLGDIAERKRQNSSSEVGGDKQV